jgi:predicted Holliday junction resolvase-like endonuclease
MWDWAIWAALILVTLAGVAALALLAVRVRDVWRSFNETRRAMIRGLDKLAASAEAVAEKAAAAEDTAELEETLGRLRVTLARLAVLRAALDEAQVTFRQVTAVLPRR